MDTFTERSSRGYFSRIGNAIAGILFGIVLIFGSFILLSWNEGRSIKTYKSYVEGARDCVSVESLNIIPENENKLIHISGFAETDDQLADDDFDISANALRLKRHAEMYQWTEREETETREKLGGGEETITTYHYEKNWVDHLVNSSDFRKPAGHENPSTMPYQDRTINANPIAIGAFHLNNSLTNFINNFTSLPIPADIDLNIADANLNDGEIYIGANPSSPEIGDQKVWFQACEMTDVSLVAAQTGNSFKPYQTDVGREIEKLYVGRFSKDEIFDKLQQENTILTWILRGVGTLLMFIGFTLLFKPLQVIASVIPLFGNVVGMGTFLASLVISLTLSLLTIAISWVVFRPVLGICLLLVVLFLIYVMFSKIGTKKA